MKQYDLHEILVNDEHTWPKLQTINPRLHQLYYIGNISLLTQPLLGVVWPRKMSMYAKQLLEHLFASIVSHHLVTISGLAEGVDQTVHTLSIQHSVPTIAVVGWGLIRYQKHRIYRDRVKRIIDAGGLLLSEYVPDLQPARYTFPQRNRIIAALADMLYIPEAGHKSGSLITAEYAYKLKKPIYGSPQDMFSTHAQGVHMWIQQGRIQLVQDFWWMLDKHFTGQRNDNRTDEASLVLTGQLTEQQQQIIHHIITDKICSFEKFITHTNFWTTQLLTELTHLEIQGYIEQIQPHVWKMCI